ncbi:RDD family protein [Gordonia sp. NPDC003585]|uniref:RDD family protein n=1 Tax=Gordonia sp. NPDC003585 TaxID=3154275 RepID=UPI0033B34BB7
MSDTANDETPVVPRHPVVHGVVHDRDKNAGIVSRGIAAGFDLGVVGAILGSGYLGLMLIRFILSVQSFTFAQPNLFFTASGFLAVSVLYLATCWAVSGRTLGSVVMGLRVVNHKGVRMRPIGALLRALICTFFAIGLLWVAVDSRRRSVADLILRTRVIYSR